MKKLFILMLFISTGIISQTENEKSNREIVGFVYNQKEPLPNVNILINGTTIGTTSSKKGYFKINAKTGDILVFKYLGFDTVKIYIEDITSMLNVKMITTSNVLPEMSLITRVNKKHNVPIVLGQANINVSTQAFGIRYLPGEKLIQGAVTVAQAIRGKFPGLRITGTFPNERIVIRGLGGAPLWDVDGMVTREQPLLNPEMIEHIAVINSLAGTSFYGSSSAGGVILISTKSDYRNVSRKEKIEKFYQNQDYYNNDAVSVLDVKYAKPDYIKVYDSISNASEALNVYKEQSKKYEAKMDFHLNILNYFIKKYNDKKLTQEILSDFENNSNVSVEDLKTIVFRYQEINELEKAMVVLKKIAKIRPNYSQTFRDIANTFLELGKYENAWKIYKYYFQKDFTIEENNIGEIMKSEMIQTYLQRKKDPTFKEIFKTSDYEKIVESDVRFVFEWNTSEAEFDLEFVNSNNQIHREEFSMKSNNSLILNQKVKGYTSKEFLIENLDNGKWLVNLNYLGNKQYKPTYLKVTTYYNWGRPQQTKEIKVFELKIEDMKVQLLNI